MRLMLYVFVLSIQEKITYVELQVFSDPVGSSIQAEHRLSLSDCSVSWMLMFGSSGI